MTRLHSQLETALEGKCVKRAAEQKFESLKTDKLLKDWPDRLFFRSDPDHHFFVEFKLPGEQLRARQALIHRQLKGEGYRVYTCHSLEEMEQILESETS